MEDALDDRDIVLKHRDANSKGKNKHGKKNQAFQTNCRTWRFARIPKIQPARLRPQKASLLYSDGSMDDQEREGSNKDIKKGQLGKDFLSKKRDQKANSTT